MSLLLLAIAPGFAIMVFIYLRDKYEREPLSRLLLTFIGGVISTIPAVILSTQATGLVASYFEPGTTTYHLGHAFGAVALSEEASKLFFVWLFAYRSKHFNEPFDGIVYAVMVSMGFATLENILYVYNGGIQVAILRMFTAVPAHATFGIMMGYFLGLAKFRKRGNAALLASALLWPVVFHGFYDYSLFDSVNYPLAAFGAILSLIIGIRLSKKAITLHQEGSPFKDLVA